jgi:hypothetical protein
MGPPPMRVRIDPRLDYQRGLVRPVRTEACVGRTLN